VGDTRGQYADLARLYLPIAIAVFAVIALVLVSFLVRFRARRPGAPSRRHEHNAVEIGYVVVLAAIAAGLIAATFHTESKEDALAARPALRVDVIAAKWRWSFGYPGLGVSTRPTLVVPAGRTVQFAGRSLDVIHDFWVPDVRFQRQVFPDHVERWDLVFPHAGTYQGLCAWFCGLRHQDMRFEVRALAPAAFDAWVARSRA
jgi:cytochrome c oxidase subunit 2